MTLFVNDGKRATEVVVPIVPVVDGGTGAADAATAKTNLAIIDGVAGQKDGGALTTQLAKINFKTGANGVISVVENVDTMDVTIGATVAGGKVLQRVFLNFVVNTGLDNVGVSVPPGITQGTLVGQLGITPQVASSSIGVRAGLLGRQTGLVGGIVIGWIGKTGITNAFNASDGSMGAPMIYSTTFAAGSVATQTWMLRAVINGGFAGANANIDAGHHSWIELIEYAA